MSIIIPLDESIRDTHGPSLFIYEDYNEEEPEVLELVEHPASARNPSRFFFFFFLAPVSRKPMLLLNI